jgi:hypothetical protein
MVLADGSQQCAAGSWCLAFVRGSDEGHVPFVEPGLGLGVAVTLVHDEDDAVRMGQDSGFEFQQVDEDFPFVGLEVGQAKATGRPWTVVIRCRRRPQK